MSQIRKQSIISSVVVYIGFALGFVNTYLFTREGGFTKDEYGLTAIFIAIASLMASFSSLGMTVYVSKFYPYYNDNLPRKKNDMLTWALLVSLIGFCLVAIAGIQYKDLIIRKFGGHSPKLITYYYWVFPFGLGLTLYGIVENFAWQIKKAVLANFLREVQFRLFTTILIVLTIIGVLTDFDLFIKIYSFTYLGIAFIMIAYLIAKGYFHLTFSVSIVTKKFYKKILILASFVFGGNFVFTISSVFDSFLIASVLKDGLAAVAVFTLAQNIASLIQAPQRGVISASMGPLSQAWKDKDFGRIQRIYQRSSINQLVFAVGMFSLIWLNFTDGVFTFHFQKGYLDAKWVFFFIGLMRIVDMGTGVNAQIITTSVFWRFDFFTGLILVFITLPLDYVLTKHYFGVVGPAIANLISFTIYNAIRYWYIKKKFDLQPFTIQTLYTILLGLGTFFCCYFLLDNYQGFVWIVIRSTLFCLIYLAGILLFKLSPDIQPVWQTVLKRAGIKKED
ncbi:oligosaccharide flippase family protein [Ferruginibacter lapsinanis]|uniref:polysaccharide biosynthesis C-terminal domain-containing protein n=1 Tax=Ferruginibacter lapsinanis TaxID=563172 RepID=UPI001E39F31B|nr:oligosaccharide flippase family protein [Ferruginibacter lapsinanis]UEG49356.1 oligosaccharide flippase family protein [Ferruginibacter lapsinanis]